MKVVVTGGLGKLGQYVVRALLEGAPGSEPHTVTVFDQVRGQVPAGVRLIVGDAGSWTDGWCAGRSFDAVIHLAGIPAAVDSAR